MSQRSPNSSFNLVDKMTSYSCGGGMSGSTLTQLRSEYEETIVNLKDEKRELIMKISAAITEKKRAEQNACNLEDQLSTVKDQLTASELTIQRLEYRQLDDNKSSITAKSEASLVNTDLSTKSSMITTSALERSLMSVDNILQDEGQSSKENESYKENSFFKENEQYKVLSGKDGSNTPKQIESSPPRSVFSSKSNMSSISSKQKTMKKLRNLSPMNLVKSARLKSNDINQNNQECTQS